MICRRRWAWSAERVLEQDVWDLIFGLDCGNSCMKKVAIECSNLSPVAFAVSVGQMYMGARSGGIPFGSDYETLAVTG